MPTFPCPLCDEPLEILSTKKKKPYLQCEEDGIQIFFRYEKGIERLREMSSKRISFLEGLSFAAIAR